MFKRLFFWVSLGFLFWNSSFATSSGQGSSANHEESFTGPLDLHYTVSPSNLPLKSAVQNSGFEQETLLVRPFIQSIETNYDNCKLIRSTIKTVFPLQILGFYTDSGQQLFEVRRQVCLYPDKDAPSSELTCFNSKETLTISSDENHSIDVDIDLYNLRQGRYFVEVTMFVTQLFPPAGNWPITYSAMGETKALVVAEKNCENLVD
ncbi:hypothetical protein [Legionella sp. W05-934-2]|uniref:hypothetical protein n=1 Tax=Legionella sp. W05-934-2 TaxID=1198649 RepID=UPI003461F2F0